MIQYLCENNGDYVCHSRKKLSFNFVLMFGWIILPFSSAISGAERLSSHYGARPCGFLWAVTFSNFENFVGFQKFKKQDVFQNIVGDFDFGNPTAPFPHALPPPQHTQTWFSADLT